MRPRSVWPRRSLRSDRSAARVEEEDDDLDPMFHAHGRLRWGRDFEDPDGCGAKVSREVQCGSFQQILLCHGQIEEANIMTQIMLKICQLHSRGPMRVWDVKRSWWYE